MERTVPELPTNNTDLMPSERTKQLKMKNKDKHVSKNIPYNSFISSHSGSFFSVIKQKEYKRTLNQTDTDPSLKSPPPPHNPSPAQQIWIRWKITSLLSVIDEDNLFLFNSLKFQFSCVPVAYSK